MTDIMYEVDSGESGVNFIVTLWVYRLESLDSQCHLLGPLLCLND